MIDLLRKITKSTAIYSIGQIAPKLIGLILLPFFTNEKYLSPDDYGKMSMLEAASAFLITLFGFGFNYALERWYYDKDYVGSRRSITFTLVTATIFLIIVFWGLLSLFSGPISELLTGRSDWFRLLNLLFFCSALESIIILPLTLLRLEEKPVLFVTSNIFRFTIYLITTIIFLIPLKQGLEGIYLARAVSSIGILAVLMFYLVQRIEFKFEWKALRDMTLFRLPLVLSTFSYVIFNITDRFSIRFLSDSSFKDVGVYSLGYSIVNSVKMVILASIWLSLRPIIYQMMNDPGNKRFYSKIMKYMSFFVVFVLLLATTFGQEAIMLLAKSKVYYESFYIIPIISLALIFDTLKEIAQAISLNIIRKTAVIAVTMILATVINLCLNIVLIPYFNIYGAAISTVISQIIFFSIIYRFAQKYYPVPYETGRIVTMIGVFIILGGIAMLTSKLGLVARIPLKILILCAFPVALYYLNFFESIEIERLKGLWKKLKNPADLIRTLSQD